MKLSNNFQSAQMQRTNTIQQKPNVSFQANFVNCCDLKLLSPDNQEEITTCINKVIKSLDIKTEKIPEVLEDAMQRIKTFTDTTKDLVEKLTQKDPVNSKDQTITSFFKFYESDGHKPELSAYINYADKAGNKHDAYVLNPFSSWAKKDYCEYKTTSVFESEIEVPSKRAIEQIKQSQTHKTVDAVLSEEMQKYL